MKWQTFFSLALAVLMLAGYSFGQSDGLIDSMVNVIAKDGIFTVGGTGKEPFNQQSCADPEIFNFLDSAGAVYIEQVFPGFDPAETLGVNEEGDTVKLIDLSQYYQVEFTDSVWWEDLCSAWVAVDTSDTFEVIEQAGYATEESYPVNDPRYYLQNYLTSSYTGSQNVDSAWQFTTGSSNVKVCVIDDGIDVYHEDLASRITAGYNAQDEGTDISPLGGVETHGTHVAGIISAATNNGLGVAGINWNSQLYIARAATNVPFLGFKWYDHKNTARSINWASGQGVDVINMSFGKCLTEAEAALVSVFRKNVQAAACFNAWKKGVFLIAAKGNENGTCFHTPSDLPTVMGVGSCNLLTGERSSFSNYGYNLDIMANGEGIHSTLINNDYGDRTGTSMSSPIVVGVASLLKSYRPDLTADEIEQIMEITALDRGDPGWDEENGWGILKADSALKFVTENLFVRQEATTYTSELVWDTHEHVFYNNGGLASELYFAKQYLLTHHFDYSAYNFEVPPTILARLRGTKGWSAANPNYEFAFTWVVPGSVTETGCDVKTYAYFITNDIQGWVIDDWWPCNNPPCDEAPDVKFKITVVGKPNLLAPDVHIVWQREPVTEKQAIRLYWSDPNLFEDGWIVQRQQVDSTIWDVTDTLPSGAGTISYYDTTFVGSEIYRYRVCAFKADYLSDYDSLAFTAPPRWPRNFTGEVILVDPAGGGGGATPPGEPSGGLKSNSVRLQWSPPLNQNTPVYYEIRYCDFWTPWFYQVVQTPDQFIVICSLETELPHFFNICTWVSLGGVSGWLLHDYEELRLVTGELEYCPGYEPDPIHHKRGQQPLVTQLSDGYPNPFNPSTSFEFSLANPGQVTAAVYNTLGQRIKTVHDGFLQSGVHTLLWDGTDNAGSSVASGVYFLRVQSRNFTASRKMLMLK